MQKVFVAALALFFVVIFWLMYTSAQGRPECKCGIKRNANGRGELADDVSAIIIGKNPSEGVIDRAMEMGSTLVLLDGLILGDTHQLKTVRGQDTTTVFSHNNGTHSVVLARFVGGNVIYGDAPFDNVRGSGNVYLAGSAYHGVHSGWEQLSRLEYDGGVTSYRVMHSKHPGLYGTQFVSPKWDLDLVIGSDGILYVNDVSSRLRNMNKQSSSVLVGGSVVAEEVFKKTNFGCVRTVPPDTVRKPVLLAYTGICASYTSFTVACSGFQFDQWFSVAEHCNANAIAGYANLLNYPEIKVTGSCPVAITGALPVVQGRSSSTGTVFFFGSIGDCEAERYRWVCTPDTAI